MTNDPPPPDKQAMPRGLIAVAALGSISIGVALFVLLGHMEQSGGTVGGPAVMMLVYALLGRGGVLAVFGGVGAVLLLALVLDAVPAKLSGLVLFVLFVGGATFGGFAFRARGYPVLSSISFGFAATVLIMVVPPGRLRKGLMACWGVGGFGYGAYWAWMAERYGIFALALLGLFVSVGVARDKPAEAAK